MWSPDGTLLASGSVDQTIKIWNRESARIAQTLLGHTDIVRCVACVSTWVFTSFKFRRQNNQNLGASYGNQLQVIEDRAHKVNSVSFSYNGQLLAASSDEEIRIYRCDTWKAVIVIPEPGCSSWVPNVTFHPNLLILATPGGQASTLLHIWKLDFDAIHKLPQGEVIQANRE